MTNDFMEHLEKLVEDCGLKADEEPEDEGFAKSKWECICPGCRTLHTMKMNWVGRGVPRKLCQSCREKNVLIDVDS